MKRDGHVVGLHSREHKCPIFQGIKGTRADLESSLEIMNGLDVKIKYFRPPWGTFNLALIKELRKRGLKVLLWSVMVGDWSAGVTADEIADRLLAKTGKGSVICIHDGRGAEGAPGRTVAALEKVLPVWIEEGYRFETAEDFYRGGTAEDFYRGDVPEDRSRVIE